MYDIIGDSKEQVANSAFEACAQKQGFEAVCVTEPTDGYCMRQRQKSDGKTLVSVTEEGLGLPEGEEEKKK